MRFNLPGVPQILSRNVCFPSRERDVFLCHECVERCAPNVRGYSRGASARRGELNALVWLAYATLLAMLLCISAEKSKLATVVRDENRGFLLKAAKIKFFTFM